MTRYNEEVQGNKGFHRPLYKTERKSITSAMMDWIVFKGILLRITDFPKLVSKIIEIFPREPGFIYFKPPKTVLVPVDEENGSTSQMTEKESETDENEQHFEERRIPPTGFLFSSYRYRITKKRKEAKEYNQNSKALYRYVFFSCFVHQSNNNQQPNYCSY